MFTAGAERNWANRSTARTARRLASRQSPVLIRQRAHRLASSLSQGWGMRSNRSVWRPSNPRL